MLIKTDPDILTVTMINDYFKNVRTFCTQSLTSEHEAALLQTGNLMLISIIGHIIHSAESERQIELFQQIQRRFMLILRDYDREWIWELLGTFSKNLPEQNQSRCSTKVSDRNQTQPLLVPGQEP